MNERMTFEDRLEAAFERYVQGAPRDVDPSVVARAALASGGHGRLARLGRAFDSPAMRLAAAVVVLLLALAAAVLIGSALQREPPLPIVQGEFTRLGSFTTDGNRQALPLADGRVLLTGIGTDPSTGREFGVAEIFDPATRVLTRLDDEPILRHWTWQGLVRLADGRVLVTGGMESAPEGGNEHPADAEIIDPADASISTIGPMIHPRYGHTATLLGDSSVLLAGGDLSVGAYTGEDSPAELFDPDTGTFREIGPMQHGRLYHRATLLEDGRVLLTGGYDAGQPVMPAEVFDPGTESFTVVGEMRSPRVDHTSTLLADGRVLLVGGNQVGANGIISDESMTSVELFDPTTGTFADTGPLTTERSQHAAVHLPDGRVLIAGGWNRDGEPATTELFDPATGGFVRGADTLDRLGNTTAALLPDGKVLVVGESDRLELFDPSPVGHAPAVLPRGEGLAGTVTPVEPPLQERAAHTATLLSDGRVLVVGGALDPLSPFDSAEVYDPRTGSWSATGALNAARAYHAATLLPDGRVLVAGGQVAVPEADGGSTFKGIDSAEAYDPATGAFTPVGPMTLARSGTGGCCPQVDHFAATVLTDGRVLIAGGTDKSGLDLFDPRTNTFTAVPAYCQGDSVLLPDGRVLIGCAQGIIFDPATNQVAPTDTSWLRESGARLADGRLLFTDAIGSEPLVLHPEFELGEALPWSAMATFNSVVWDKYGIGTVVETITPLPDGRSLVFASRPDDTNHPLQLGFASVFDPDLVTFTEVASPAGRHANTATMLQDGRILFAGTPVRSPDRTDPEPPVAEILDLGLPR